MAEALTLAKKFPDTSMVLNHTGMPVDRGTEEIAAWRASMKLLASAPNMFCKISGLGMGDWHWTTDSIRPLVLDAIDAFGTERCMFASNFPVDKLFSSYDDVFNAFKAITRDFPSASGGHCFTTMQSVCIDCRSATSHGPACICRCCCYDWPFFATRLESTGALPRD